MAPRRTKAAGEDDRCPTLRLIMEKGPLSGQTSEFSARSVICIGRYVRGNTLVIKDAGISSKHLRIKAEATVDSGARRWTVTDLGSSNGTFLNGKELQSPAVLSDGDVIKIGEQTSIIVGFVGNVVENKISSTSTRKNATGLGVIDESSELGFGNKEDETKTDDVAKVEMIQKRNVSTTGSSQENNTELKDSNTENKDLGVEVSTRRTRSSRKEGGKDSNTENKELGLGVSTRRTRSSRKEGGAIEAGINVNVTEGRKTRGRKKIVVETIPEETEKEEEKVAVDINSGKEDASIGLGSTSGLKENNVNTGKGKMVADLETMTMGEWFDFLEVYLPQQIVEESEAKITEMRQMAERYHEFMVQQKKLKE